MNKPNKRKTKTYGATVARPAAKPRRRVAKSARVGDMTQDELRAMIQDTLSDWLGDPDAGLTVRPEIVASVTRQRAEYAAGKRGKSFAALARQYGVKL